MIYNIDLGVCLLEMVYKIKYPETMYPRNQEPVVLVNQEPGISGIQCHSI